jgi:1-deoxy-D-xylulose-5-phosphate synthase
MYEILKTIDNPSDVKKLSEEELVTLAGEMREALFNRLTKIGGHCGPNFGIVETTIALHYVFDSPRDKVVFDVSHQSYSHKMLTGRRSGYILDECFAEDSGYTNPEESEHDFFNVGHTSTSIALASGLAKARDLKMAKENIIAVIGDGSLSGGEAMEGLNIVGEMKTNFIVVVNDNEMSIAENHGGLYKNLRELRESKGQAANNIFRAYGFDYIYEENGNDVHSLIELFRKVKDIDHPIVVHIHTQKGKGYLPAEQDREKWHWSMPFDRESGAPRYASGEGETYSGITLDFIMEKARKDKDFFVITAAVPGIIGLSADRREELGSQYIDVGIAEEAAVALASGAAKNGAKPLFFTNMTFMQRAYDQISQDLCLNNNPVTMVMCGTSFAGMRDVTHLGIYGLAAFTNIPNLVVLAPTSAEEYRNMLEWSVEQREHPVMILVPGNAVTHRSADADFAKLNTYKTEQKGEKTAILALGDFYQRGEALAEAIEKELGYRPTLINPRYAAGLDTELLEALKKDHSLVLTLEDGIVDGGFGQKIASYYGSSSMKVLNYGLKKEFYDRYDPEELLSELGMTTEQLVNAVRAAEECELPITGTTRRSIAHNQTR